MHIKRRFDQYFRDYWINKGLEWREKFFQENNNPQATEKMKGNLLMAEQRGVDALKSLYYEIEGWMGERMGDVGGEFQGGAIDVVTADEVKAWKEKMSKVLGA